MTRLDLRATDYPGATPITGTITLEIGDETVDALLTASLTPAPFESLLPIFRVITDELTARGVARAAADGRALSCRAGCGACCRQAVPIAAAEARAIAALVAAMPDDRRAVITARFAAGRAALAAAGVTTDFDAIGALDRDTRNALGARYFRVGVACPFLEDESCSIHPDRPLSCREYLVTSPPSDCADPAAGKVVGVPLAGHPSAAVIDRSHDIEGHGTVVLIDALDWTARHPPLPPEHPGIELALTTIARLPGKGADHG
jgi:Fe-S-cluster containining protein